MDRNDYMGLLARICCDNCRLPTWNNKLMAVRQQQLGNLLLPTGKLVATDPVNLGGELAPFAFTVDPGTYSVIAGILEDEAGRQFVAAIQVRVRDRELVAWEMATIPGQDINQLKEGEFFGFGVDGSLAIYLSAEAAARLSEGGDTADAVFRAAIAQGSDLIGGELFLPSEPSLNVIYTATGYGDGFYPSYVCFDDQGDMTCLITDFLVAEAEFDEKALNA